MDFGIARLTRDKDATRLTQQGYLIGTVLYMAPEQLLGSEVDILCDIWSYGVIYYELLAGRNPFETGNVHSEMYKIAHEEPVPLISEECPEALQAVVRRLLSKDRELRFQSLEDVQLDTEPVLIDLQKQEAQRLLPQVQDLCSTGAWDKAQTLVRSILELDPQNREARSLRERIQYEAHRRAVKPRVDALVQQGDREAEQRHFTMAIELFDSARKLDSADEKIQNRLRQLRSAKEANDQATELSTAAKKDLRQNRLTSAQEQISEALRRDPEHPDAKQLLVEIQQRIQERERDRQVQAVLHKSRGLIAVESFDEALDLLMELDKANPGRDEIKDLISRTVAQNVERERRRQLAAGLAAAKAALKDGKVEECIRVLTGLAEDFPNDPEVAELLGYAHQEVKTKERVNAVEALNREVAARVQAHRYDEALEMVQAGLRTYPDEVILSRLLRSVLSSKQAYEKERALEEGLLRIQDLRQRRQWQEALRVTSVLLEQHPDDPELLTHDRQLREEIQKQERAAARLRNVQSARALLDQGQPSQAIALLHTALKTYVDDAELGELLNRAKEAAQEQEVRQYVAEQVLAATELEHREDWPAAAACIGRALERCPARPELIDAQRRIESARQRAERDARIDAERTAIEEHCQARNWGSALARIQIARDTFPEEESFLRLLEEVQRRRNAEIVTLLQEARKNLAAARLDDAEAALRTDLATYAGEPAVQAFAEELAFEKLRHEEVRRREEEKRNYIRAELAAIAERERDQDWTGALEIAHRALGRYPNSADLGAAARRIEDAIQRLEMERRIAAYAEATRRFLADGNWRAAAERLQKARADYPDQAAFSPLWNETQKQKSQELSALLAHARQLFSSGDLGAADAALREKSAAFSPEPAFDSLLAEIAQERARRDEAARKELEKQKYIADQLTASQQYELRKELSSAVELIRRALNRYPADPVLSRELKRLEDAWREFERERRIAAEANAIEQELAKRRWDAALSKARKADAEFDHEPVFQQLGRQAEEKRRQEIEGHLARARAHLLAGELEQAEALLRKPLQPYSNDPGVAELAAEIASERLARGQEVSIRKHITAGRLADAGRAIQEFADRFPNRSTVFEFQEALREAQLRQQKEEIYRKGNAEAEQLFRACRYDDAVARYQSLLVEFPGDAKLDKGLKAAVQARDDFERRKRLEAEIARLEELKRNGAAEEVRAGALLLLTTDDTKQVRDLLKWAKAALAKPAPAVAEKDKPGSDLITPGTLRWILAATATVVVAIAIGTIVHFRGTAGSTVIPLKAEPATLRFSYEIGGSPVTPLSIDVTGGAKDPQVQSSVPWLAADVGAKSGSKRAVTVRVNPSNLQPGQYPGQLTIVAGATSAERQVVNVNLQVTPAPEIKKEIAAPVTPEPAQPAPVVTPEPPVAPPPKVSKVQAKKETPRETRRSQTEAAFGKPIVTIPPPSSKPEEPKPRVEPPVQEQAQKAEPAIPVAVPAPPKTSPAQSAPAQTPPPPSRTLSGPFGTWTWVGELPNNDALVVTAAGANSGNLRGEPVPFGTSIEIIVRPPTPGLLYTLSSDSRQLTIHNRSGRSIRSLQIYWKLK
jgi:predicted Zn-dependent protease